MSRTWEVGDPIADHRDGVWRIGAVAAVDRWAVTIRWDGAEHLVYRSPGDLGLVDPDTVPIDERHWLPAKVRDQLVRQEAAGRLRAMAEHMEYGNGVRALALLMDEVLVPKDHLTAAARALLAPAPQLATTPTTEGLPA